MLVIRDFPQTGDIFIFINDRLVTNEGEFSLNGGDNPLFEEGKLSELFMCCWGKPHPDMLSSMVELFQIHQDNLGLGHYKNTYTKWLRDPDDFVVRTVLEEYPQCCALALALNPNDGVIAFHVAQVRESGLK